MRSQFPHEANLPLSQRLAEIASLFLKLGITSFGGPAAHIAMMHDEVVKRRRWMDDQQFLDLLGATNLIPGPNSTEMAIHIGFLRAGWLGLVTGGICFILPATVIVMALAWAYVKFGSSPTAGWLLYGVKPVIITIIVTALWDLGWKAVKGRFTLAVGIAVFILYLLRVNEIALLAAGGVAVMAATNIRQLNRTDLKSLWLPAFSVGLPALLAAPFSLSVLFFTFLKIGAVLYGSGYVLLAFMRADFVARLGWLTDRQLIDAIAIGQVTPGPFFTTATFVGFILGGMPGAMLATLGIFLPSFIFVAISNPLIPKMRSSSLVSSLLDGVNIASLGLMGAVTFELAGASLVDPLTVLIALVSLILIIRFRINNTWLVVGGAILGFLSAIVR
jgi:chromate transporter